MKSPGLPVDLRSVLRHALWGNAWTLLSNRLLAGLAPLRAPAGWGLVALGAGLVVVVAAAPSPVSGATRTVQVGVYQNEPKIFLDENGRAAGIFIELLGAIAAREGWTLAYTPCEWADCLLALEAGQIDLMPDVAYSPEREVVFDFHTTPVIESWSRIYAAPQSPINTLSDLNGRRIVVLRESIQQSVFEQLMSGFGYDVTLIPADSLAEAFAMAADGSADAAIANHLFGDYFRQAYGLSKTTIDFNPTKLYYATGEGRNADLLQAIDRDLDAWIPEPGSPYYTTLGHWTGGPGDRLPPYAGWIAGGLAGLLLAALGIILFLRRQVQSRTRHLEQANAALRESERRYQLISTVVSDYVFSTRLDAEGQLVLDWVAGAFETITGYTVDDYIAHGGWRATVHPDDLAVDDRDMATLRAGQRVVSQIRTLTKSGATRWVQVYAHPVLDQPGGELVSIYGAVQDITERKRAEAALRDKEQQLSSIFDNVSDALFYLAVEPGDGYRFLSVNRVFLQATGMAEAQVVGQDIRDIVPPPAHELVLGKYQEAIREHRAAHWEEISVYPGGKKHGEVSVTPIFDAAGCCTHLVGIVHDITERKQAEEEVRRRADEFASLYETARDLSTQRELPDLLEIITNRTARLLNTSDASIYLYDPARDELELAASNVYAFPRGTRFPMDKGVSSQVVRSRQSIIVDDYRVWPERRPETQPLGFRAVALAPLTYREEVIGALGVAEIGADRKYTPADMRLMELLASQAAIAIQNARLRAELEAYNRELERRVAERTAELEIARQRAESADHLKSAFLATMSHELRTPLNSIIGFTGVLLQGLAGPLNPEQTKQMGMARDSARHLLALINDVLDISKIEAGQLEVRRAPFEMRAAIEDALRLVSPQAQKKGLSLTAAIASNVGGVVSDQRRVEQILLNLLSNAIKFTERGEVRLDCRVRDGFIETSVRDTGIGIRPDDLGKLFEPFRQIETGLNRRHEGTGLGLSICKNLVELLGGRMHVESEWGAGSAFTFVLPLAA